jgi:transcriptional regulator with XRE-family HTH domain
MSPSKGTEQEAVEAEPGSLAVGRILAETRRANGWTLAEMSRRTGVSISALSKIEHGRSEPAYSVLTRLAQSLDIDFVVLLGGSRRARFASAARAVTRASGGLRYHNEMGLYEALATDLAAKSLEPMLMDVLPREPGTPGVRSAHHGEEFVYVIEGDVVFEMSPYAPTLLGTGDSVYFDGSMDHGFFAAGATPSRILSVCYTGLPAGKGGVA